MNIINKFTLSNINKNKKRTIVTTIGIALSTALICAVAGMVMSFQNTVINYAKKANGDYHVCYEDVPIDQLKYIQNNIKVESYYLTKPLGYAKLEGSKNEDKPYLYLLAFNEKSLENSGLELTKGRMPQNDKEIVISRHIEYNGRVYLNVGDEITLNVGTRMDEEGYVLSQSNPYQSGGKEKKSQDIIDLNKEVFKEEIVNTKEKTYKIVGIIERPNSQIESYSAPGYTIITYMTDNQMMTTENDKSAYNVANISVTFKEPKNYQTASNQIQKVLKENTGKEYNETKNMTLLEFQGALSETALKVLYSLGGIIIGIIVVSSVFVIRNSFSISISEKTKQLRNDGKCRSNIKANKKKCAI